jgi:hypothetical protein
MKLLKEHQNKKDQIAEYKNSDIFFEEIKKQEKEEQS